MESKSASASCGMNNGQKKIGGGDSCCSASASGSNMIGTNNGCGGGGGNNEDENDHAKLLAEMKSKLTPLEYRVTQEKVTERPFSNRYNRHWEPGSYHCVVCNIELFKSDTKFESTSGWPAFYNVVDENRIKIKADTSHVGANILLLISRPDLARKEVSCSFCKSHLGHLFQDGPKPTGLRYCVNSNSLIFHPSCSTSNDGNGNETDLKANTSMDSEIAPEIVSEKESDPPTASEEEQEVVPATTPAQTQPSVSICINTTNNNNNHQQKISSTRRDSANSTTPTNKGGKFCMFTNCLPKASSSSSPETSPTTPKHYYAPPNTKNAAAAPAKNSRNSSTTNKNNVKGSKGNIKPIEDVEVTSAMSNTTENSKNDNCNKDEQTGTSGSVITTRRFGTDVQSPTNEFIEKISRRPSNGVLRETSL